MELYLIVTNSEFNHSNAKYFDSALSIPESNVIMFTCIFAEGDKVFADVIHMSVCATIDNVFAADFVAGDVGCILSCNILSCVFDIPLSCDICWDREVSIVVLRDYIGGDWLNE